MAKPASARATPQYMIADIVKGSEHALTIFTTAEISALEIFDKGGKPYLKCWATAKDRPAKPEEIVRQLFIRKLIDHYGYAKDRLRLEKEVYFGSSVHEKRADIVVVEKDTPDTPYIIIECKKAKRKDGLEQLKSYCNAEGAPIGLWTNGSSTIGLHREDPNLFRELPDLPTATQTLAEMLSQGQPHPHPIRSREERKGLGKISWSRHPLLGAESTILEAWRKGGDRVAAGAI